MMRGGRLRPVGGTAAAVGSETAGAEKGKGGKKKGKRRQENESVTYKEIKNSRSARGAESPV